MTQMVLIVDDHPLMRQALSSVIEDEPGFKVVAEASNGEEAIAAVRETHPNLVVMDLLMPVMDGVQAIQAIHSEDTEIHILALSSTNDDVKILESIQAGALGFLSKESQPQDILKALKLVSQGEFFLDKEITQKLLQNISPVRKTDPISVRDDVSSLSRTLTEREREILDRMADGCSNREIAQQLFLSEATIRSHIYHILNKLGLENRNQAIVFALKNNEALINQSD